MKLRMMLSALLFAAGIGFVAGCGDSSSSSSSGSSSGSKSEKEENFLKIVKESAMFKEVSKEGMSDFKYEKTVKVYSTYVMVCGYANIEGKGERPVAFHLKKWNGKWNVVEFEDHWGPKRIDLWDFVKESDKFKEALNEGLMDFVYEKTVEVSSTYSLVCGEGIVKGSREQVAFHVKSVRRDKTKFCEIKVVDWEDNWEPKDKYRK